MKNGEMYYNCSIIDIYDRSIVASVTREKCDADLAIKTVRAALSGAKKSKNIMLHSDQGSQFASKNLYNFKDFKTLYKCINNYIFVRYNYTRPHTFNNGFISNES